MFRFNHRHQGAIILSLITIILASSNNTLPADGD